MHHPTLHSCRAKRRSWTRAKPRCGLIVSAPLACLITIACSSPPSDLASHDRRIERAESTLPDDPAIRAEVEAVRAARARERGGVMPDEMQVRISDDYIDEHQIRVTARVPVMRPGEIRADKQILRAETEMAVTRLEEATLARRAELCFPSVAALTNEANTAIYAAYRGRQEGLLAWSEEWRSSGMTNELDSARFELDSRLKLATRAPAPAVAPATVLPVLPEIESRGGELVDEPETLRELVRRHHPSVALRHATAERYAALASRARSRAMPWIRFLDLTLEHRTGEERASGLRAPSQTGMGGKVAFNVPIGGRARSNGQRYDSLVRAEHSQGEAIIEEQMQRGLQALADLRAFEASSATWLELEALATKAEEVADRWWQGRLARPNEVATLLDDAFDARIAVLDARERAGVAQCALLAMTGVPLEGWPRALPQRQSDDAAEIAPHE